MKQFDSIIIGAGQAGTPLVFSLATKGEKVALIEKTQIGGTCLNVGCVPTKTYVASARRAWDFKHAEDVAIDFKGEFVANLSKIKNRKDQLIGAKIDQLNGAVKKRDNISYIQGEAKFVDNKTVEVNGEQLTAPKVFLNIGGRPFVPNEYKDIPHLTSTSILQLTDLPEHLVIIGGSYIGLEFSQIFARFGSKVTVIERGARIIGREDEAVSVEIHKFLKADGVNIITNAQKIEPEKTATGIKITVNNEQVIEGSHLMLAIGRVINSDKIGIENTDIKTNARGVIETDDVGQTSVEGIFALGDCNGKGAFTHTAFNDFQVVENYVFGDKTRKISDRIPTYGLFVDPPLGRCGMTKQQALDSGKKVLEAHIDMKDIARAREKAETYGFMNVLIDAETNLILGASVLGSGGDEIVNTFLSLMVSKQPYTNLRDSVILHPTISELIPTMLQKLKPLN
ncbi:MAG: mercuric reductase [Flavobacteriaceae bacterium]